MLFIDPDACIDCEACVPECPTNAIFRDEDVPEEWTEYIALNEEMAERYPGITEKQTPKTQTE